MTINFPPWDCIRLTFLAIICEPGQVCVELYILPSEKLRDDRQVGDTRPQLGNFVRRRPEIVILHCRQNGSRRRAYALVFRDLRPFPTPVTKTTSWRAASTASANRWPPVQSRLNTFNVYVFFLWDITPFSFVYSLQIREMSIVMSGTAKANALLSTDSVQKLVGGSWTADRAGRQCCSVHIICEAQLWAVG